MIDCHSQILLDGIYGTTDLKENIEIIKAASRAGFSKIIITPPYNYGKNISTYEANSAKIKVLNKIIEENNINVTLYLGNEIDYSPETISLINETTISTINQTNYVLVKFPLKNSNYYTMIDSIFQLQVAGYRPIICHVERYDFIIKNPNIVKDLIRRDAIIQLDCLSILGLYRTNVKNTAKTLLKKNMIHLLGTNAKTTEDYEKSTKAYKKIKKVVGEKVFLQISTKNSEAILNNHIFYPE